jgi:hypothetical protein
MPCAHPLWTVIAVALLIAPAARAEIGGTYKSALGTVKISESNGAIVGKLVGQSPCGFKSGTVILKGDRLDDSITGEVRTCKVGGGCKGSMNGLAMLLITRNGSVISGYVHADAGSCKTPLDNSAVAFKRNKGKATGKAAEREATADSGGSDTAAKGDKGDKGSRKGRKGRRKGRKSTGEGGSSSTSSGDAHASSANNERSTNNSSKASGNGTTDKDEGDTGAHATASSSGGGTVGAAKRGSLDDGAPPVSPGAEARDRAETLAAEGMRLLGEPAKARLKFEEAVEVDPAYAEGWLGIGVTDYLNDRYDDAEDNYKRALEANPAMPDAYYNLACLYSLKNDKEKAFNYLRIAVLNGFVDFGKVDQDPDLNNLHDDERYATFKAGQIW